MRTLKLCVIFSTVLLSTFSAFAQEITVAAAADLQFAMQDIAARFEKDTGKKVKVVYGSSGNFYQQIQNGAPFDVFFSANLDYAKKLEAAGLAEPGTLYQYATGKIVLWVPSASKADLADGLKALAGPGVRKVSIANPEHAPYGHAAVAALQKENLYEQVKSKLVMGENISQAASFVLSGSADRRDHRFVAGACSQYERQRTLCRGACGRLSADRARVRCSEGVVEERCGAGIFGVFEDPGFG